MTEQFSEPPAVPLLVADVSEWLSEQTLGRPEFGDLLQGCCQRLFAMGIPLMRMHLAYRTLHPLFDGMGGIWLRDGGFQLEEYERIDPANDGWLNSPLRFMIDQRLPLMRRRLTGPDALVDFPLLEELRDMGATDWVGFATVFETTSEAGMVGSWATDRLEGFSDAQFAALTFIQRPLAVAIKMTVMNQITTNVVNTYLGPSAGERVLSGQIKHGDGETIPAAILISDMRGSTEMAEKLDRETYIATLNQYFGCMGEAVLESGGEILDFIGDAVLAIFPIQRGGFTKRRACQRALGAAREADARIQKLNIGRATDGAPPLGFGIGLHVGEVMFGNIGTRDRLTFSVIGSSVNEVSRLEGLTKELEQSILVTGKFAESLSENWVDLGVHTLRGVGKAMQVLAPKA